MWGGNDSTNMYVYNPSNFNVNYANSAGSAKGLSGGKVTAWDDAEGGNLQITAPDGTHFAQFDCYNNNGLRIYTTGDGSKGIFIGTDGNVTITNGSIVMANGKIVQWASGAVIDGNEQSLLFGGSGDNNYQLQLSVAEGAWSLHPVASEKLRLGSASYKWREIYSNTGAIQTSDRNQKDNIYALTDNNKILQFFLLLQPVSFTFRDGTSGRTHIGFISQDVETAMKQVGMTDLDFAGFCKDQKHVLDRKTREVKQTDPETGESYTVKEEYLEEIPVEGEYIYSLRYEEFIAINTMMIQQLYADVAILKKDVQMLKNNVD